MQIINTGNRFVNSYLIRTYKGVVAVDSGYRDGFDRYRRIMEENAISFEDIRWILLTHAHDDHAGFLNELLRVTDAKLILHPNAVPRIATGENASGHYADRTAAIVSAILNITGSIKHGFEPITDTARFLLWDGFDQPMSDFGLQILSVPGHTSDSISLVTEDFDIFCGDAAMNGFPSKHHISIFLEDETLYAQSWETMLASGAKMVYPGHGEPFPVQELRSCLPFAQRMKPVGRN